MRRFNGLVLGWAALLALGFVLVFTLGARLPTDAELLDVAMHPAPPVSEAAARTSASTIVSLQYEEFQGIEPTVERRTDFGIDYWLISYASPPNAPPKAVAISIGVDSGLVEVVTVP